VCRNRTTKWGEFRNVRDLFIGRAVPAKPALDVITGGVLEPAHDVNIAVIVLALQSVRQPLGQEVTTSVAANRHALQDWTVVHTRISRSLDAFPELAAVRARGDDVCPNRDMLAAVLSRMLHKLSERHLGRRCCVRTNANEENEEN